MFVERLMATVERCGAWIMGLACTAAGYLFLLSLSGWDPENSSLFAAFRVPGWLHTGLLVCAVLAFVVCLTAMLLAVTVEARRIDTARQEPERRCRPVAADPPGATCGADLRRGREVPLSSGAAEELGGGHSATGTGRAGTRIGERKEG